MTYAALFEFPLRLAELHERLMDVRLTLPELEDRLAGDFLAHRLERTGEFLHPVGKSEWVGLRRERTEQTHRLLSRHRRALSLIASWPFVRLVALSGGCAHDNATDDDVDVFLVVRRGRAWSVTLGLMILAKALGLRRTLCVNYVVDEEALALPETDRFTATEMISLRPLAGRQAYEDLLASNPWVGGHYPNFFEASVRRGEGVPEIAGPRWIEAPFAGTAGDWIEELSRWALGRHLRRRVVGEGVILSAHRLKLHGRDSRPRVTSAFAEALRDAAGEDPGLQVRGASV